MNLDLSVIPQNQKSGLQQTNPGAFIAGAQGLIRLGQGLQDAGDAGANFALAEQKLFNATHMTRSDTTRQVEVDKLRGALLNPQLFNAQTYEQQYNNGIKKINEALVKKAPNSRLKALVGMSGLDYHAGQSPTIAKEARVFRVKQLMSDGLQDVRQLRASEIAQDDSPTGLLRQKEIQESINTALDRMVEGNIIDPVDAQKEKDKFSKDRQQGALRKALYTAKSEEEYEELLRTSNFLDEQEKEIFLDKYRTKSLARDKFAIAQQERAWKLSERERTLRHRKNDAAILSRANDLDSATRPTDQELDEMLEQDLISVSAFNSVSADILNPPKRAIETNGESYQKVLNEIEKPEKDRTIDAAAIWAIKDIEDPDKRTLINILKGIDDNGVKKGRQIMTDVIGTPETFIALERPGLIAEVKTLKREFYDRVQAGEDPVEVANDITDKWKKASDVTSDVSQNRIVRKVLKLPSKYRIYSDTKTGLKFPDTYEINLQASQDFQNGDITRQEFLDITDNTKLLEEVWTREAQEKHGGRKTAATQKRERKERKEQEKIAEEQAAKKLEEEKNSLFTKAKEATSEAFDSAKDTASDAVENVKKLGNIQPNEIVKALEDLLNMQIPEVPVDNRNLGASRKIAEKLQAKERKEKSRKQIPASPEVPEVQESEDSNSFIPDAKADIYNSLPDNIENISLAKLKSYAKNLGYKLRRSERKKLTALLKSKGVKGDALRKLEEQISLGLTRDN